MKTTKRGLALAAVLMFSGSATRLHAIGAANIGNEVPSARAAGQGYVGVAAQNNDPTVAWSNPAGVIKLKGTQFAIGGHYENIHGSYETLSGSEYDAKVTHVFIPNASLTHLAMNGTIGLGITVQSPFGLETHWKGDSPLRYVATDSRLATAVLAPSMSFYLVPGLSIGGGPAYARLLNAQLDRKTQVDAINVALGGSAVGAGDGTSSLKGDGDGWGAHAGVLYEPNEHHALGATYRSKITMKAEGRVKLSGLAGTSAAVFGGSDYSTAVSADVTLPENLQLGYAYKPNQKWTWEVNTAWYGWSKIKQLSVRYEQETNPYRLAVLNTGNPFPYQNRDAWSFATGVNYKRNDTWQYRGGFWYEPWAQAASQFTPAFMDLSRYGLSAGVGYEVTPALSIDAAYNAVFFAKRRIQNSVGASVTGNPAVDIDGEYDNFANLIALNLTYRWSGK